MEEGVVFLKDFGVGGAGGRGVFDADAEDLTGGFADGGPFFRAGVAVAVHPEDVLGDVAVTDVFNVVGHDEEKIETGEEGVGEGNVLVRVLVCVVLAVDWIGCGNDGTAGVEGCVNTGFGDCNGLLFHYFVDCDSVDIGHFVEFIDTDYTSVGKNHGTGF